jgi:hypothetical protein
VSTFDPGCKPVTFPSVRDVLVGVAVLLAVGAIGWLVRPLVNRFEPRRMKMMGDHGIKMLVYGSPEEMEAIGIKNLGGLEPFWLTDDGYYFADGLPDEDPPQDIREWSAWARRHSGEGAYFRHLLIRIQATQDRTVLLLPPRVHVARTETDSGIVCSPEKTGGNGLTVRQFFIDLDAETPEVKYFSRDHNETPQFVMHKGDSKVFVVIARATSGRFQWYIDVRLMIDGVSVELPAMDKGGRAFVTVGHQGLDKRWWRFRERRWDQAPW